MSSDPGTSCTSEPLRNIDGPMKNSVQLGEEAFRCISEGNNFFNLPNFVSLALR